MLNGPYYTVHQRIPVVALASEPKYRKTDSLGM